MERAHVVRAAGWVVWSAFLLVWLAASMVVVFTIHAAVTDYWGSEWEVSDGEAVGTTIVWLLAGGALSAGGQALRRPVVAWERHRAPPEVRRRAWLVLAVATAVLLAVAVASTQASSPS